MSAMELNGIVDLLQSVAIGSPVNPWIGAALLAAGVWLAASIPFALYAGHVLKQLGEVQLSEVELDELETDVPVEADTH